MRWALAGIEHNPDGTWTAYYGRLARTGTYRRCRAWLDRWLNIDPEGA